MKKFRFALSSVSVVREVRETLRREVFASAVRETTAAERALEKVIAERAALAAALAASRAGTFRPALQTAGLAAQQRCAEQEVEAASLLQRARQALEQRRTEWLAARRDVRLLEQLKDRAKARHRIEVARAEQRELDDRPTAALLPVEETVSAS
jgi:flagellar FliJ protein